MRWRALCKMQTKQHAQCFDVTIECVKISGKKYIFRKVWLIWFLSYYTMYIQTHNGISCIQCLYPVCNLEYWPAYTYGSEPKRGDSLPACPPTLNLWWLTFDTEPARARTPFWARCQNTGSWSCLINMRKLCKRSMLFSVNTHPCLHYK